MNIRKFQDADADEVSALIVTTLRTTNIKDYSSEYIENDVKILQPHNILERARWTHFYVVCNDNKIVGCGAIGPYWDKKDESSLFTIFVLPEYQGRDKMAFSVIFMQSPHNMIWLKGIDMVGINFLCYTGFKHV